MGQILILILFANRVGLTLGDCLLVTWTCYVATSHFQTARFHRETENWKNELNFLKLYFLAGECHQWHSGGCFFFLFLQVFNEKDEWKIENQQVLVSACTLGCLSSRLLSRLIGRCWQLLLRLVTPVASHGCASSLMFPTMRFSAEASTQEECSMFTHK